MNAFKKLVKDILSLKIQGESSIVYHVVNFLKKHKEDKNYNQYINTLRNIRPTEPMLRNLLDVLKKTNDFDFVENYLHSSYEKIKKIGAKKIKNNRTYLTHCHSHTVVKIFEEARNKKNFNVIFTETRPNFQGRLTAKDLSKLGINATMIIDSAVSTVIKNVDFVLVGCDAITSEGNLINKIGTNQISIIAKEFNVPFFSATQLLKFDPKTIKGFEEKIEERDYKEIWNKKPKSVKIFNPIFDITPNKNITAYITEEGIINPNSIINVVIEKYRWILNETI